MWIADWGRQRAWKKQLTAGSWQRAVNKSHAVGVIRSLHFAVVGHRAWGKTDDRLQQAADSPQLAVSLSVISYSLFGKFVSVSCFIDLYDF